MINGQLGFWDKPRIVFVEDDTILNSKFVKGAEFEVYMEQGNNYIIYIDKVFHGPLKEYCRKVGY